MEILGAALAGIAAGVAILGAILKVGGWGGSEAEKVKQLEYEIRLLRDWRHDVGNFQQKEAVVDLLFDRVKRLESKVFNGKREGER